MRHLRIAGLIILAVMMMVGYGVALDPPHSDVLVCQNCHGLGKNFKGNLGLDLSSICIECHSTYSIGTPRYAKPANPYGTSNSIIQQHRGTEHAFMGSDTNVRAKAVPPTGTEFNSKYVGQLSCGSCHFAHVQPEGREGGKYLRVAMGNNDELCLRCHGQMNVLTLGGTSHPLVSFSGYSTGLFTQPQYSSLRRVYVQKGNKITCTVCHTPHNAYPYANPTSTVRGNEFLGRAHMGDWLCAQCHKKPAHGSDTYGGKATCTDCHSTHNPGNNIKLVKNVMKNTHSGQDVTVNFTGNSVASDFIVSSASNVGPYPQLGICQVCHTKTKRFRNYSLAKFNNITSGGHPNNGTCLLCHAHEEDQNFVAPNIGVTPVFLKKAFGKESCATCHGYPPNTGAHILHSNSNNDKTDCAICHPGSDTYTSNKGGTHQQATLTTWNESQYYSQIRPYINLATWITKHSTDRLQDTCAGGGNPDCHSSGAPAAKWGDTTLSCNACHANPPATGKHTVHMAVRQIACKDCHYSVKNDNTDVRNHIKAITVEATDADLYKKRAWSTSYSYNIAVDDRERNNGVNSYSSSDKSCANVQCHNPSGGSFKARWLVDGPSCSLCHQNSAANSTGTHYKHLSANTNYGRTITCNDCHPAVGASAYNHISSTINYIEINAGITYTGGKVPGDGSYGSCGKNTCHQDGTNNNPVVMSYTWNTVYSGDTCAMCHAMPNDTYKHYAHYNAYIPNINPKTAGQCTYCHSAATASTHINATVNVVTTNPSLITVFNYNGAGAADDSCQASCHSQPSATLVWGAPAPTKCTSCHYYGNNLPAPHPNHFFNQPFVNYTSAAADHSACGLCHPGAESYTTSLSGTHGNGVKNVGSGGISYVTSWTSPTCTSNCHATAAWSTSPSPLACADCHGNPPTTNKHTVHAATRNISCTACHYGINTTPHLNMTHNDWGKASYTPAEYIYGRAKGFSTSTSIEVDDRQYNNGSVSTWAKSAKTCATAKCHNPSGTTYSANWVTGSNSCTLCHGDSATLNTGSHSGHLTAATNGFGRNIMCTDCHSNNTGNYGHFMVNGVPRGYVDFSGAVYFRYTTADRTVPGVRNKGYCTTNTCHNNGKGVGFAAVSSKIHWGTAVANTPQSVACNICHNFNPNTGRHFDHFSTATTAKYGPRMNVSTSAVNCNQCHSLQNTTTHINGVINFRDGGKTLSQTNACNTCHTTAYAATAKSYWTTGSYLGCETCHPINGNINAAYSKYTTSIAGGVYAPKFAMFTSLGHGRKTARGAYPVSGNPAANRVCLDCHSQTSWVSGGTHITNTASDFKRLTQSSADAMCNYCHGANQPGFATVSGVVSHNGSVRFSFTLSCGECHEVHGGSTAKPVNSNRLMIRAANSGYYNGTVVFTARTGADSYDEYEASFVPGTSNNDDICATCHVNTYHNSRTKDGKHGSANNGADYGGGSPNEQRCTNCHSHKSYFKGSGCNGCHGVGSADGAPRTAVMSKYSGSYGAHSYHLDYIKPTKMVCDHCHGAGASQGTHTGHAVGGATVLRANVTMSVYTGYKFNNLNPGYTFGSNPTQANCTNTSCHYGASPKWKCRPY